MSVQVLLSTYNGEKYLKEQLDSVLSQSYKDLKVLIRDDGSNDGTKNILCEYKEKYPERIDLIFGRNIGVIKSFFELMEEADLNCAYFAFSDQDDVWMPEKIQCAVNSLESNSESLAYGSNLRLVDENLVVLGDMYKIKFRPSFKNAILENFFSGCTLVFKRRLIEIAKPRLSNIDEKRIIMHDWFLYLASSCFGAVLYDGVPHILYRQHGSNSIGLRLGFVENIIWRIKIKIKYKHMVTEQIRYFYELFGDDICYEYKWYIERFLGGKSFLKRLRIILKTEFVRQNVFDSFATKILYLFNVI